MELSLQEALVRLTAVQSEGKLSAAALENIRTWLTDPRYAEYAPEVVEHIAAGKWQELDDVFWTIIPFGTGGRRGRMYPIGCNAINDRTIGESAQGLADYVKRARHRPAAGLRHRLRHAAPLARTSPSCAPRSWSPPASQVYFLDGYRSTPELSFAVRYKQCDCGIMVTASHNPPSDNAVKVYWSTGGQLLPPHDQGVIERVHGGHATSGGCRSPRRLAAGRDRLLPGGSRRGVHRRPCVAQSRPGPRDLKIIYSPLHGVGASAVLPGAGGGGLSRTSRSSARTPSPTAISPTCPTTWPIPRTPPSSTRSSSGPSRSGAELILATDPDCDRVGLPRR